MVITRYLQAWPNGVVLMLLLGIVAAVSVKIKDPTPIIFPNDDYLQQRADLYQGDILLTDDQKMTMKERKSVPTSLYWPSDKTGTVTIKYRFNDTIIDRAGVRQAIAHWTSNTCLKFQEISRNIAASHLIFADSQSCNSYLGRVYTKQGQTVNLHKSCIIDNGRAVHEIGHAIGFYHEQSRSDRDSYVIVNTANIQSGMEHNFDKAATLNYGVEYDYFSDMHYGPAYFSANGNNTLSTVNPFGILLIGNRRGLSFNDKKLANLMYKCTTKWLTACGLTSERCLNLGYTGANCSCVCPDGTSGTLCQTKSQSYFDALIAKYAPYTETITFQTNISTPGYPTPNQSPLNFIKYLKTPSCYHVQFTINDFYVYPRDTSGSCLIDYLTIQPGATYSTSSTYCGTELAKGRTFTSTTNEMIVLFHSYDYTTVTWSSPYRGFHASVNFIKYC